MHQFIKLILYWNNTLHVSVFPSIIRSSRLYIQQQVYVKHNVVCLIAGTRWNISSDVQWGSAKWGNQNTF